MEEEEFWAGKASSISAFPVKIQGSKNFRGGPLIKTSPSNGGDVGLIPGREAKIPHILQPKTHIVTNSIKTKNGPH